MGYQTQKQPGEETQMNERTTTPEENIPDFVNLEEYRNLLGELEHLEDSKDLTKATIKLELDLPEILVETMKILATLEDRTFEEYKKHLFISSLAASIDCCLRTSNVGDSLYKLAQEQE